MREGEVPPAGGVRGKPGEGRGGVLGHRGSHKDIGPEWVAVLGSALQFDLLYK